jgi:hypothetical protein
MTTSPKKTNARNVSYGVFTSSSALAARPSHELNRLYFRTTSNESMKDTTKQEGFVLEQAENLGQVHAIGKKTTKYLPYQYKQSPLCGKDDCWYAKDFVQRESSCSTNRALAESFKNGYNGLVVNPKMPLMERSSALHQQFKKYSKDELKSSRQLSRAPKQEVTKTTGGVDMSLDASSSESHQVHRAHPCTFGKSQKYIAQNNLCVSGIPDRDSYRTTYGSNFLNRQLKNYSKRSASAPSLGLPVGSLDLPSEHAAIGDPEIVMTRQNIFTSSGK